jgi:hypothetical protein
MLVGREAALMNAAVVGEAYDIAAYYLAMRGMIPRDGQIHDRLLQIIYRLFGSGIRNRLLLANKAIAAFERHHVA